MSSGIEGGYSVVVNYQPLQHKYRFNSPHPPSPPLPLPKSSFFNKYRQNGSLLVSFIEFQDFMSYQLVNWKYEFLPLAAYHIAIAHLCNQFKHDFPLLISMPRLKALFFYQNRPKIKLFLEKNASFRAMRAPTPNQGLREGVQGVHRTRARA